MGQARARAVVEQVVAAEPLPDPGQILRPLLAPAAVQIKLLDEFHGGNIALAACSGCPRTCTDQAF